MSKHNYVALNKIKALSLNICQKLPKKLCKNGKTIIKINQKT